MINTKSKKAEVLSFLNEVVADKGLISKLSKKVKDMLSYTIKAYKADSKSVLLDDLRGLALDIQNDLVVADEKPKKTIKKTKVEAEAVEEAPKKKLSPKKAKVEPEVEKEVVEAKFSDTIKTDLGEAVLVKDEMDIAEFSKRTETGEYLVACIWTSDEIKSGLYDPLACGTNPKKFDKNMDITQPVYFNENGKAFYTVSIITEVMRAFTSEDMTVTENTGDRLSNGLDWAIYKLSDKK